MIVWAVGNHSVNPGLAGRGKTGVLVSFVAAALGGQIEVPTCDGGRTRMLRSEPARVAGGAHPHGDAAARTAIGVGHDDRLCAQAHCAARAVDATDVGRLADIGHYAVEARLRSSEYEARADAADREWEAASVEK